MEKWKRIVILLTVALIAFVVGDSSCTVIAQVLQRTDTHSVHAKTACFQTPRTETEETIDYLMDNCHDNLPQCQSPVHPTSFSDTKNLLKTANALLHAFFRQHAYRSTHPLAFLQYHPHALQPVDYYVYQLEKIRT